MTVKATKGKAAKKTSAKRKPSIKREKFVEEYLKTGNAADAARQAGYSGDNHALAVNGHRLLTNVDIAARVERRREEARRRADIEIDELIGMLAEVSTASIGDVLDENGDFDLARCRENQTDHLLKKVRKVERHSKDTSKRVTYDYEMYSRMDAIEQLRDTFGVKMEPRKSKADEDAMRAEVERSLARIMERDRVDQQAAARLLREEVRDIPSLLPIVNSYVH